MTEVIVIRGVSGEVDLRCGGHPMAAQAVEPKVDIDPDFNSGTVLGKRYFDEEVGLEVLVSKSGNGSLSIGRRLLAQKDAKPLPTSD